MRFTKSQLSGAERKLKEPWFRYGYCKGCRTKEVLLPNEDLCLDCATKKANEVKKPKEDL